VSASSALLWHFMMKSLIVVTALLGASSPAAALDQNSGNYWIQNAEI